MSFSHLSYRVQPTPYPNYHVNRFAAPGGGGVEAPAGAADAGGGGPFAAPSKFQQSLNSERAGDAVAAMTFAKNAPMANPATSAYGSDDRGQQAAAAGRDALVARQRLTANSQDIGSGVGWLDRQEEDEAESGRKTKLNTAQAGAFDAQAFGARATGTATLLKAPAQVNQLNADAYATRQGATDRHALVPGQVEGQGFQNQILKSRAETAPAIEDATLRGLQNRNDRDYQLIPEEVEGARLNNAGQRDLNKQRQQLFQDQAKYAGQKGLGGLNAPGGADPVDPIKQAAEVDKTAQEMGERAYNNQNLLTRTLPFVGDSKASAVARAKASLTAPSAPAGTPGKAPIEDKDKFGRPIVWQEDPGSPNGGHWVLKG